MMDPDFLKRCDDGMTTQAPTRPWTVKRTSIYGANGQLVFVAAPMTTDADSQLAAAAHELLAALTLLLDTLHPTQRSGEFIRIESAEARAAIDKAMGKL